jgi:hypothetical protein
MLRWERSGLQRVIRAGFILVALTLSLWQGGAADSCWNGCTNLGPGDCTAKDVKLNRAYITSDGPCVEGRASGMLYLEIESNRIAYCLGTVGDIYAVKSGAPDVWVTSFVVCLGTYTGIQDVAVTDIQWDCDRSLELRNALLFWNENSQDPCPQECDKIPPKCKFYTTKFTVEGSALNTPPTAADNTVVTMEDFFYTFGTGDFNYFDDDGDPLNYVQITGLETVGDLQLDGVDVALNQEILSSEIDTGRLTFVPAPDGNGMMYDSFDFKVHDGTEYSTAAYSMTIDVEPVNDSPIAAADMYIVDQDAVLSVDFPGVLANDSDVDGDPLLTVLQNDPLNGTLYLSSEGAFTYEPDRGFYGTDVFSYVASDGESESDPVAVEIEVRHVNHPPQPDAGGPYEGWIGEPIWLDASLTFDYDFEDDLEYRWDLDYDGRFDTDWLKQPLALYTWDEPYQGIVTLQVRDLFQGTPTGEVVEATAFALIHEVLDLWAGVFYDANGNGVWEEGDPGLSGIPLVLDGEIELATGTDGEAIFGNIEPGWHAVMLPDEALLQLASAGYMPMGASSRAVEVVSGEPAAVLFPVRQGTGKLSGIVFFDDDGDGAYDPGESPVPGVRVVLDGDRRTIAGNDGRFFFLQVAPGEYRLRFTGPKGQGRSLSVSIAVGEEAFMPIAWPQEAKGFLKVDVKAGGN